MDIKNLIKETENFNVLYIEDDLTIQEGTKSIFENLFLSTDTANDGDEGLKKYQDFYEKRKDFYDLVISDINMPIMDGIQMSQKILDINNKQAILMISAFNESDKLVKLIDLGVANFIHKPIEINNLFDVLGKISQKIVKSKDFEKNFHEIKRLNLEYNRIIENYDKFVIVARTDLEGKFVYVSEAYENISGYTKEELIGKNANILRDETTPDDLYKSLWKSIRNGKIWSGEIKNKRKDEETYWISSIVSPYMDENDEVIGYHAISEDITEQKKIECLSYKLQKKNEKLKDLLDNTDQGFLSCNKEMLIEKDYSLECEHILGIDLKNKNISTLLFENDHIKQDLFRYGFNLIVNEEDILKKEQILSLMPKEHYLNDISIKIEYKLLKNSRLMLILTNNTQNKKLESQLENERVVYRMIIGVIVSSSQFWELKNDFINFIENLQEESFDENFMENRLPNIFYELHTFKGLFSQKELIHTPKAIHKLEEELHVLVYEKELSISLLENKIKNNALLKSLNLDMELITNILGEEFLNQDSTLKVNVNCINNLENQIRTMLTQNDIEKESLHTLLEDVSCLKKYRLADILNSYGKQVELISKKLSKNISKVEISCPYEIFVNEYLSSFIKSLVHVFRNSIIHGIESQEEREALEKDKFGKISCKVTKKDELLEIEIEDDGRGFDFNLIKQKALNFGYEQSQLDGFNQNDFLELLFNNNLSTSENKNEYAGCGVGLGAVNEELKKLNGKCNVYNSPEKGTKLTFIIPINKG